VNYTRGRQYDNLALLLGRGLITTDGADWRRQRRLVQPVFDKALLTRVAEITAAFTTELVDRWEQARQRDEQVDLIDGDAAPRSRRELRDQAITLFFAGFETTAVAMAWTWLLLSENPGAEARLHEELDEVLGGRAVPTAADLKALGVALQVVQESMRMYPPVYTLTRTAAADSEICGHQIGRGDNIVIPVHALQHMEQYWEQPAAFCPERFAPGRLTDDQRLTYLPFSYGERRCLGASFATTEIVTMLAVACDAACCVPTSDWAPGFSARRRSTARTATSPAGRWGNWSASRAGG
jgi:cytochrome P450